VNTKPFDRILAPATAPELPGTLSELILSVRPARAPVARFLTRNEEWAALAIRALRKPAR
jgi:hypothetical protein